jgi:hypothetical protein
MKSRNRYSGLTVFGALITMGMGCQGPNPEDGGEESAQAQTSLAEVTMADGSRLTFLEPQPGLLAANAEGGPDSAAIRLFKQHEGSALALYEAAANQAAPQALVEAQGRVDSARVASAGKQQEGTSIFELQPGRAIAAGAVAAIRQPLSAADFQAADCPNTHNFLYCYTNVTGTWIVTRNAQHVHACVNAVVGSVNRKLEYDTGLFAGWTTYISATVNQGVTVCTRLEAGNQANYRFTVDQASGNTYHGSFYGNL